MPTIDPTAIRVPTSEKPTIFNKDAALGYFLGTLMGGVAGAGLLLATGGTALIPVLITSVASSTIGTLWGGLAGKRRMEKELVEGAPVSRPSFWNKNIFSGLAITGLLTTAVAAATALIAGPEVVGWTAEQLAGESLTTFQMLELAALPVGFVAGGMYGRGKQAERYEQAEQIISRAPELSQGLARTRSVEQGVAPQRSAEYQITPQEQEMLNARLRQGGATTNFAQQVEESRQQPNVPGRVQA